MAATSIPHLTLREADALVARAETLGKRGWLENRTLSALLGGYPAEAEHNLMMVWEALQGASEASPLPLAA